MKNIGKWTKYGKDDAFKLYTALTGTGINWNTDNFNELYKRIQDCDIYIYCTKDSEDGYSIPKIYLEIKNGEVLSVMGDQESASVEYELIPVLRHKIMAISGIAFNKTTNFEVSRNFDKEILDLILWNEKIAFLEEQAKKTNTPIYRASLDKKLDEVRAKGIDKTIEEYDLAKRLTFRFSKSHNYDNYQTLVEIMNEDPNGKDHELKRALLNRFGLDYIANYPNIYDLRETVYTLPVKDIYAPYAKREGFSHVDDVVKYDCRLLRAVGIETVGDLMHTGDFNWWQENPESIEALSAIELHFGSEGKEAFQDIRDNIIPEIQRVYSFSKEEEKKESSVVKVKGGKENEKI